MWYFVLSNAFFHVIKDALLYHKRASLITYDN